MRIIRGVLALICVVFVFAGCSLNRNQENVAESDDGGILDITEVIPENNTYQAESIDYASLEKDEYDLRLVIEAYRIHKEKIEEVDSESGSHISQYGIDDYWQEDSRISLHAIADMQTMFGNTQFKSDFELLHGVPFDIDTYDLPSNIGADQYDIDLIVIDNQYYFNIQSADLSGGLENITIWGVYQTSQAFDIAELAQMYAQDKNNEMHVVTLQNGVDVYYFTVKGGCSLFEAMGVVSSEPTTVYLWKQDGALGVIIRLGEHTEDNLELCVLEKHELN